MHPLNIVWFSAYASQQLGLFATILNQVLPPLTWIVIGYMGYLMLVPLAGLVKRYRSPVRSAEARRFAVVIPAHNEAEVITPLIEAVHQMDYPRDRFETFVVADNCTDATAEVARQAGAVVIERHNRNAVGKGHALEYGFSRVLEAGRYDAVVVIDADNLVAPDFLGHLNDHLAAGHLAVQCRKQSKNPDDNWVTALKTLYLWSSNRFWFVPKHNLGLSAVFSGSGMCIAVSLLEEYGWGAHCLTEDFEYTAKLMLHGQKVHWADEAVVFEEQPRDPISVWNQHVRWAKGQNQVFLRYAPALFKRGVRSMSIPQIESGLQLFQTFFPMLALFVGAISKIALPYLLFVPPMAHLPIWVGLAGWGFQYAVPLLAYVLDGERNRGPLAYVWLYPLITFSWALIDVYAVLTHRRGTWIVTQHTRPLTLADLAAGDTGMVPRR